MRSASKRAIPTGILAAITLTAGAGGIELLQNRVHPELPFYTGILHTYRNEYKAVETDIGFCGWLLNALEAREACAIGYCPRNHRITVLMR